MDDYDTQAKEIERNLVFKQTQEIQEFLNELERVIPLYPKDSAKLLALKKT